MSYKERKVELEKEISDMEIRLHNTKNRYLKSALIDLLFDANSDLEELECNNIFKGGETDAGSQERT